MPYEVVSKVVRAIKGGKLMDFDVRRYYATFYGKEPSEYSKEQPWKADPFIEVWADGSITLHDREKSIFLYDDQWEGIIKAVRMAIDDKKNNEKERRNKWLRDTADTKEFFGVKVDLSRNEVIAALESCEITVTHNDRWTTPVIVYKGVSRGLGRTDLNDNVATGLGLNKTAEEWREFYLKIARYSYGGRLQEWRDGRLGFSVIDAISDG